MKIAYDNNLCQVKKNISIAMVRVLFSIVFAVEYSSVSIFRHTLYSLYFSAPSNLRWGGNKWFEVRIKETMELVINDKTSYFGTLSRLIFGTF